VRLVAEEKDAYQAAGRLPKAEVGHLITELRMQMKKAAENLEFEKAALLRDQILELQSQLEEGENLPEWERIWKKGHPRKA
jgi:excinuclease ABC subunit B